MNKKTKKIIIISFIILIIIIISLGIYLFLTKEGDPNKNTVIRATKIEEYNGSNIEIEYKITINNYDLQSVIKTIKCNSKEIAEQQYRKYEFINEYERRNIGLELKGKSLILTMPEEQFKEDIEYNDDNDIIYTSAEENQREIINQDSVIEALQKQGYTIK